MQNTTPEDNDNPITNAGHEEEIPVSNKDNEPDLDPMTDLDNDAPPEFICPITMSVMKDPVIMPDGQTYEREAIRLALQANPTSPLTREPMSMDQARTNYALKNLIDKYIQNHLQEIEQEPTIIDPSTMFQETQKEKPEIPITKIQKVPLDTFSAQYTPDSMLITIKPQNITGRLPVSVIAIIDISTSMIIDATIKDLSEENTSISRIQLVQYSLKTIIATLGSSDKLTIVTFSGKAKVIASGVFLTQEGKERVNKIIDDIDPDGSTNLWDGLDKGINEAIKQQSKEMNTSLLVFTDGQPNINPPMGLIPTLKDKLSDMNIYFSISTFGYGFSIDANLLEEIAEIGNGVYGYIPDASMVGTIFINYISNLVSIISPLAALKVNFNKDKPKKFNILLYNGSETNVMIPLKKNQDPEKAQINLNLQLTNESLLVNDIKQLDMDDEEAVMKFNDQKYRQMLIDLILETKENISVEDLRNKVIQLFEKIKNESNRSQFMKYLMIDLYNDDEQHGDIERAYRKGNFNTWGKNYLYSLLRFHILEQCGNFRDMSLQLYGNECFKKFRKIGNRIFMNLPIPEKRDPYEKSRNKKISYRFSSDEDEDSSSERVQRIDNRPPPRKQTNAVRRGRRRVAMKMMSKRKIPNSDESDSDEEKSLGSRKPINMMSKRRIPSSDKSDSDEEKSLGSRKSKRKISDSDDSDSEKLDMEMMTKRPSPQQKQSQSRCSTMRRYYQKKKSKF